MSQATLLPCQKCGFESPENARFCRSCGAALTAESEFTGAATRNYGRQEGAANPMSAPLPSRPLAPSVVDSFGDETRRQQYVPPAATPVTPPISNTNPFYSPQPPAPAPQYGYAPPYQAPPQRFGGYGRRGGVKWAAGALAIGLAMAFGNAMNRNHNNMRLSPEEMAVVQNFRRDETYRDKLTTSLADVKSRSERDINERIRQIDRAREDARRAAERGIKADITGIPLLDLDKYEYGQATVSNAIRIPGKEMRIQNVKGDFPSLVQHYESLLGKPIVLQNVEDDDEKRALFQSEGSAEQASVSVLIKKSDEFDDQWEILIVRSPFSFPRGGESRGSGPSTSRPEIKTEIPGPAEAPNPPNQKDVVAPKAPVKSNTP